MQYIICYDISSNPIRTRLAKLLTKKKGKRLQKSVFALEYNHRSLPRLKEEIYHITQGTGSVIIFRQCKGCKQMASHCSEFEDPTCIVI